MARKLTNIKGVTSKLVENYASSTAGSVKLDISLSSLLPYKDSDGLTNDDIFSPVTAEAVQPLVLQIQKVGFNQPISVWEISDGKYMIFSGHRRAKAMELLGKTTIPALKFTYPDSEAMRRRLFLGANIASRGAANKSDDGDDIYVAKQMKYLGDLMRNLEGFKGSDRSLDEEIGKEFGKSRISVLRYLQLLTVSPKLLEAESKGYIGLNATAAFANLTPDMQNKVGTVIISYAEDGQIISDKDFAELNSELQKVRSSALDDSANSDIDVAGMVFRLFEQKSAVSLPEKKERKTTPRKTSDEVTELRRSFRSFEKKMEKAKLGKAEKKILVEDMQRAIEFLSK